MGAEIFADFHVHRSEPISQLTPKEWSNDTPYSSWCKCTRLSETCPFWDKFKFEKVIDASEKVGSPVRKPPAWLVFCELIFGASQPSELGTVTCTLGQRAWSQLFNALKSCGIPLQLMVRVSHNIEDIARRVMKQNAIGYSYHIYQRLYFRQVPSSK